MEPQLSNFNEAVKAYKKTPLFIKKSVGYKNGFEDALHLATSFISGIPDVTQTPDAGDKADRGGSSTPGDEEVFNNGSGW